MRRLARYLAGAVPAAGAGGALAVVLAQVDDPERVRRLLALAVGAAYAVLVRALVRAFRTRAAARPILGAVIGPLPFALVGAGALPRDQRIAVALACALLGLVVGALDAVDAGASGPRARPSAGDVEDDRPGAS